MGEFLQCLRRLCTEHGAALIFDEVQCGMGRTGKLFAHDNFAVTPDMMALAKPLGGGFPMGAALVTDAVAEAIHPGDHASTFGANPAICAAGMVVLEQILAPGFLENVIEVGQFLRGELNKAKEHISCIQEVRGLGQLSGIDLRIKAQDIVQKGFRQGLILGVAGDYVLRIAPPLIMKKEQAREVLDKLIPILAESDRS
jgi:acetylornithine/succinyldiaminopimelate/putrescine aminotransferase